MGSSPTRTIARHSPQEVGHQTELDTFAHLHRCGYTVLISPFRAGRYDCVIDDGIELRRVQVKTARLWKGQVRFATAGNSPFRSRRANSYLDDPEIWFAAWLPVQRRLWLIPASECGQKEAVLRLTPARNGQRVGCREAARYEVLCFLPVAGDESPQGADRGLE